MPTYSYRCSNCEKVFDSFHSMSCTDPQYCPDCGAVGAKLLSASSVIFKGSGFYSTDYRDSGYLEAKKGEETPNATESGSDNKKAVESKPKSGEVSATKKSDAKTESGKSTARTDSN